MPPKSQVKKHAKPLTPLQRKQKKRKYELIHKAQVKSRYYKELDKDDDESTPDYVKEASTIFILFKRTIDKDGNVVELEKEQDEQEFDLDQSSSSEEEEEEEQVQKRQKPNPFKSQIEERERTKQQLVQDKQERQKRIAESKEGKKKYYKERKEQRGKMLARTKRGQPNMAAQMDVLLNKIQKNMD
ncbi:uncharacterized protein B0P05DRAFT_579677 [Gilbertella persicaria]|uniref:uncharacterized protein n=1 Tax=Gilbertella persicaria TaxID=101096 RepID=UPI00221FFB55|nr:uncharacterized protein B0P05DRAFT_579677 [Gilbertella persicaria]KAI8077322.1 hypothetical protein B0P05DRAFT_579677 [Gilbertella persicaria]